MTMEDLFDDPGDLGFFDNKDNDKNWLEDENLKLENEFYEPFPGEEMWDNGE
jgi:hypothetical protein